jgi:DNA phosphorothioation-associated putative methyltransferase
MSSLRVDLNSIPPIERHRSAKSRIEVSKPVSLAVGDGLLLSHMKFLDYGCGRGGDVRRLASLGFDASGWDPKYAPDPGPEAADVVNLGYVVNVIEDPVERMHALHSAWTLARKVLIVAARPEWEQRSVVGREFRDGIVTSIGTFQKFFSQNELKEWIETVLGVRAIAAAPGIFYVFRDEMLMQTFMAARVRLRPSSVQRPRISEVLYDANRGILENLERFVFDRGRAPVAEELASYEEIRAAFGSIKRAMQVVRRVAGGEIFEEARSRAQDDLTVYLALSAFEGRVRFNELPEDLKIDVRAFYGNYKRACSISDNLLFGAGNSELISKACVDSDIGKLTPEALYIHVVAISRLSPILRVFEGCGRALAGFVEEATLIKLNRIEPKVSYLSYPRFDADPHPALASSIRADLRRLDVRYREFANSSNPPILHRKETMIPPDYPGREKFERLTRQEEAAGLFTEPGTIGTKEGWESRLALAGVRLKGHRVVRSSSSPQTM